MYRVHWRVLRTKRARVLVLHIDSAAVVDCVCSMCIQCAMSRLRYKLDLLLTGAMRLFGNTENCNMLQHRIGLKHQVWLVILV